MQADRRPRRTAVVVDDDASLRCALRGVLEADGFEVVAEAGDGRTAIECVARRTPHVVLLDVSMPIMDGLEAMPHIRRVSPRSRVVVFSAHGSDLEERARAAGATDVVGKDVGLGTLRRRVLAALALPAGAP